MPSGLDVGGLSHLTTSGCPITDRVSIEHAPRRGAAPAPLRG